MNTWRDDMIAVELLLDAYFAELERLVKVNGKQDFTPDGDAEFERQKQRVKDAKEAVIRAEMRERGEAR